MTQRDRGGHVHGVAAGKDPEQQLHGAFADLPHRLSDRRERRVGVAREADVVESEDRQIARHPHRQSAGDLEHTHGHLIVETEDCRRTLRPPQQALGWILDVYDDVEDIRSHGQTIVYAVHESVGHLGIFVSGGVAKKEHDEFTSNIDLIDVLPPGLYEAVMTPKDPNETGADLISGDYLVRFEARDLDDIRACGGNDVEDERRFATVALSVSDHRARSTLLAAAEVLRRQL